MRFESPIPASPHFPDLAPPLMPPRSSITPVQPYLKISMGHEIEHLNTDEPLPLVLQSLEAWLRCVVFILFCITLAVLHSNSYVGNPPSGKKNIPSISDGSTVSAELKQLGFRHLPPFPRFQARYGFWCTWCNGLTMFVIPTIDS
jgi:hypothetical protein